MHQFFIKLEKPHFGPFLNKKPRTTYSSKNPARSPFKLFDTLTSCKKSENFYEWIRRKTTDNWTNRRRVFSRTSTLRVQKAIHIFFLYYEASNERFIVFP